MRADLYRTLVSCGQAVTAGALALAAIGTLSAADGPGELAEVRTLLDRGRYGEAERRARSVLEQLEDAARSDTLDAALALDLFVESLRRQDRAYSADVLAMAERALDIKRKTLPSDDPALAPSLENLAFVRMNVDLDLPEALALSEEALRIATLRLDPEDPQLVRNLTSHAAVLVEAGEQVRARATLEDAQARLTPDSPPLLRAEALFGFGDLERLAGEFAAATSRFEAAVAVVEEAFGPDHVEAARMQQARASSLAVRGRHDEARELAERCLDVAESRYSREHGLVARCLMVIALIERDGGAMSRSRELYEEAIRILERTCGPDHPRIAAALNPYGWLLYESWDFRASKAAHERAIDIMEGFYGASDHRVGWVLQGYGNLLRRMGDMDGAALAFEQSLALVEAMAERNRLLWVIAKLNLAFLKQNAGELDEARRLYAEALPVWKEAAPAEQVIWNSEVIQIYANVLSRSGEHAKARALLEQALEHRRRDLGPDHHLVAMTLDSYARVLERSGDPLRAQQLRREALEILERSFGPDAAMVGRSLARVARDQHLQKRGAEAYASLLRAERIRRESLRQTVAVLPERQALDYAYSWPSGLDHLITMGLDAEESATVNVREIWNSIVRSRGIVLDELAARHRLIVQEGLEPALLADLVAARERLANLVVRGVSVAYPERFREAVAAKEEAERVLAARSADFRRRQRQGELGLDEVESALPRDGALVAFVRYSHLVPRPDSSVGGESPPVGWQEVPSYAALVLPPEDEAPRLVPLGPAGAIEARIDAWRERAASPPHPAKALALAATTRYMEEGEALRRSIWDPVAEQVAQARRVFVVPDAALLRVNVSTLPSSGGGFLVEEDREIHYLSAERDLVQERVEATASGFLALGGPDFDAPPRAPDFAAIDVAEAGTQLASKTVPAETRARFRGARAECDVFRSMRFDPLHGAALEIDEIAKLWTDGPRGGPETAPPDVVRWKGGLAHETWFKARAGRHAGVHVATHGFYLGDECGGGDGAGGRPQNPLLLAGLALAGANNRAQAGENDDDGILTAEEVASLDLTGVGWVVLSGCETGRGVHGLRRAFHAAGAGTLITSLWSVDDEATRRWMRALYAARLAGASTAASVRRASLRVLEQNREVGLPDHPFYWGAFVAAGDWR